MTAKASRASEITLPPAPAPWPTVLAFLQQHFHRIAPEIWRQRVQAGTVHWFNGDAITTETPYQPGKRLCYYREVSAQPLITAPHHIVCDQPRFLVACKPHGLPVTPGGDFVTECLLERLRRDTGYTDLVPVHRLDKDTAGLVLFSKDAASRASYYRLFAEGMVHKRYLAITALPPKPCIAPTQPSAHTPPSEHTPSFAAQALEEPQTPSDQHWSSGQQWQLHHRLEKADPAFVMRIVPGEANAHSTLILKAISQTEPVLGLFELTPHTGKTHQLRVHMASIGAPLLHDRYYPTLLPKTTDPTVAPLQLLAWQLGFTDPIDGQTYLWQSPRRLEAWPQSLAFPPPATL